MKKLMLVFALAAGLAGAAELTVTQTFGDGRQEVSRAALAEKAGVRSFRLPVAAIRPGTKSIRLEADFAMARAGEEGYWVFPNGQLGFFREKEGKRRLAASPMAMFGMKTPRETFVAIVTGMPYSYALDLRVTNGVYSLSTDFNAELDHPYEDIAIEFHLLAGNDANYSGMARAYRRYQLGRRACRPLAERAKEHSELAYAAAYPEIRIRQGWKPVPSPVPEQTVQNEPPMKVVVTFDRVGDIVREMKRQGVAGSELCLVGWNQKGHDGRWPQIFPVEESLGGEAKLRALIKDTQAAGYQIVGHGNHRDAYLIADCWDAEYVLKDKQGLLPREKTSWGGGRMYIICPQRAYERFAVKDIPAIAGLGFRGLGYFDVFTCIPIRSCSDPRHPLNRRQAAFYVGQILELSRTAMGGSASEGAYDYCIGSVDSALYISFDHFDAALPPLVDRLIPIWELVYHGIILYNPFTTTVNYPVQSRVSQLKAIEFGARPAFYFYSRFVRDRTDWMGKADLHCGTDDELRAAVSAIKAGTDEYSKLAATHYAFMDEHSELAPGLFLTRYSNGVRILTNYGDKPTESEGRTVPPQSYVLLPAAGN